MPRISFNRDEIDKVNSLKNSQEVLGNGVIKAFVSIKGGNPINSNIIYDLGDEEFENKMIDSINAIDNSLGSNVPHHVPFKEGEVGEHTRRVREEAANRQNQRLR